MKSVSKLTLIDESDSEELNNSETRSMSSEDISEPTKKVYMIHNSMTDSNDPDINQFLKFCINRGLFNNAFYDFNNSYSVIGTKLPITFSKLNSDKKYKNKNTEKEDVYKKTFIKKFKTDFGYNGDINFIYDLIDNDQKGFITWEEFLDFFLPFVEYVTYS